MLQLTFIEDPWYSFSITLDNKTYTFSFTWNVRGEFWVLDIDDVNNTRIISGIKVVLNYDLLEDYKHLAIPQGMLMALDTSINEDRIAFDDFTTSPRGVQLVYIGVDELATV